MVRSRRSVAWAETTFERPRDGGGQRPEVADLRQCRRQTDRRITVIEPGGTGPPIAELDDDLDGRSWAPAAFTL